MTTGNGCATSVLWCSKKAQDIQVELVKHRCGAFLVINTALSGVTNKDATSLLFLPNFKRSTFYCATTPYMI
jgi:hypothetical protein